MLASNIPAKIPLPFASSGTKNAIPTGSQIGITAGAASLTDGFPPLTFTPLAAGGVPPAGADFNGILNMITSIQRWQSAGGSFQYDSAFSALVSGYPKGAVLSKTGGNGFWLCTVDANSTNPDTGGAGWSDLGAVFGGRPGRAYTANDWAYLDKAAGLIIQWGKVTVTSSLNITLPVAFLNNGLAVIPVSANTNPAYAYSGTFVDLATIAIVTQGTGAAGVFYVAIGY